MRHFPFFAFLIALQIFGLPSSAAAEKTKTLFPFSLGQFCPAREEFQPSDCQDNGVFLEAGIKCHSLLMQESKRVQKKLELENTAYRNDLMARGMSEQEIHLHVTEKTYQGAQDAAQYLYQVADLASKEIYDYQLWRSPPEDYDSPEITRGDQEWFLMDDNPCYGERKRELDRILAAFEKEKENLKANKEASLKRDMSANGRRTQLGSLNSPAASSSGAGQGSGTITRKPAANPASSITGTQKAISEERKSNDIIRNR